MTNKQYQGNEGYEKPEMYEKMDIVQHLEAQNHDHGRQTQDMQPGFQRLCAVHASGELSPETVWPLMGAENSRHREVEKCDRDSVPNLLDILYKSVEIEQNVPWSIHTDVVEYVQDEIAQEDMNLKDTGKRNGNAKIEIENLEYYPDIKNTIVHEYNPTKTIGATYLGSRGSQENHSQHPAISVSMNATCTGVIQEINQMVNILWDTGATNCIISEQTLRKMGTKIPRFALPHRFVTLGNKHKIAITEAAKITVEIQKHMFELICYVFPVTMVEDLVIGVKALTELEATYKVGEGQVHFKDRTQQVLSMKDVFLAPDVPTKVQVHLEKARWKVKNAAIIAKIKTSATSERYTTVKIKVQNEQGELTFTNNTSRTIKIKKNQRIGVLDLRSIGMYVVERDELFHLHERDIAFMTSEETQEVLTESLDQYFRAANNQTAQEHDPYPWLSESDPRKKMTDEEIIDKFVNLDKSVLSEKEKVLFREKLYKHKKAFSLRDEIGLCPNLVVHLEMHNKEPFQIRPFACKEEHKRFLDQEMKKGCMLGILRQSTSAWNSPVMLIPRKIGPPRIVTDFRFLNSRLIRINPSIPLVRDAIQMLGASQCEVLSVIDLKDAYHTLRLDAESQKYCGITPYFGSPTYVYQRLGMGLSVSPAIWQNFITTVLAELPNKEHHIAIMDDCLIHSRKNDHMREIESLLTALEKNGLKISPKKCQFFRTSLVYMGHEMLIKNDRPHIKAVKDRVEAVVKLTQPKGPRDCKSFCGMVNFLSFYLKDLQIKLAPIYELTRKNVPFHWSTQCQQAFEEIKDLVTKAPVLGMPDTTGLFQLYSDTSKIGCGASLFQIQDGRQVLLAFHSKKLPDPCSRYSISELELTGLTVNIAAFKTLLLHTDFEAYVDHSALVHIQKAKVEPKTLRLQKLLEVCSLYSFNLIYLKGKEMLIADFLSRHPANDVEDPREVIPINFRVQDTFAPVVTRAQAKRQQAESHKANEQVPQTADSQETVPDPVVNQATPPRERGPDPPRRPQYSPEPVYGVHNSDSDPEWNQEPRPHRGRKRGRKKGEIVETDYPTLSGLLNPIPLDVSFSGKYPEVPVNCDELASVTVNPEFKNPGKPLFDTKRQLNFNFLYMPRQKAFERMIKRIATSVVKQYNLPVTALDMASSYPKSPFFSSIYNFLKEGKIVRNVSRRKMQMKAKDYVIINQLLFKMVIDCFGEDSLVLCIPEKYIPMVLYQYHDLMLAGHQGHVRTIKTLSRKFCIPHAPQYVLKYIRSCQVCQESETPRGLPDILEIRVPVSFRPYDRMSMDIKDMMLCPKTGFNGILVATCEITNWVTALAIKDTVAENLCDALYKRIVCFWGAPSVIISDKQSAFTSHLQHEFYTRMRTKALFISEHNHGSNRSERYIQTLNKRMCRYLKDEGRGWPEYIAPCTYAMNHFVSGYTGFSPYEMVFIRKPPSLTELEEGLDQVATAQVPPDEFMKQMIKRRKFMEHVVLEEALRKQQLQKQQQMDSDRNAAPLQSGDLVMILRPEKGSLVTKRKTIQRPWVGPARIIASPGSSKFHLSNLSGKHVPVVAHRKEIKPYNLRLIDKDMTLIQAVQEVEQVLDELQKRQESEGNSITRN